MFNLESQRESFALSNMVPQEPSVNRGVWERIESGVRRLAKSRGELYVVTGPLFQGGKIQRIGGAVMVPTAMFKAVFDPQREEVGAYVVDNAEGAQPRIMSVLELEKMAGINLFPEVSERIKERAMRLPPPRPRR